MHKLEGIKVGSEKHSRNQKDHTQVMGEPDNKGKKEAGKGSQASQGLKTNETLGIDDDAERKL